MGRLALMTLVLRSRTNVFVSVGCQILSDTVGLRDLWLSMMKRLYVIELLINCRLSFYSFYWTMRLSKLPQRKRGLGRSPGGNWILVHFSLKISDIWWHEFAIFPENQLAVQAALVQEVAGRRPAFKISAWTPSMTVHTPHIIETLPDGLTWCNNIVTLNNTTTLLCRSKSAISLQWLMWRPDRGMGS